MTIPRRPVAAKTAYQELKHEKGEIVVWWYSGICRKTKTSGEPKVLVCFRRILPNGQFGDYKHIRMPITSLGQFSIGSIWKDQKRFEEIVYQTNTFHVDFSPGGWEFCSVADDSSAGRPELIPQSDYPLPYSKLNDSAWIIKFDATDIKGSRVSLLVPCMEYFLRCYGRSSFIKLILVSYSWKTAKDKLFAPLPCAPKDDKWYICLRNRTVNGDSVFLAHAYYDEYANEQARSVWAQLEVAFNNSKSTDLAFPRIGPWFTGQGELRASGIWIEEGKSFLALQILGSSDPSGEEICRGRQSGGNNPLTMNEYSDDLISIPKPRIFTPPQIISITGEQEPSNNTGLVIIDDPSFEVIGTPRRVKRVTFDSEKNTYKQVPLRDEDTKLFSGGESHGAGSGVGYAMYKADQTMESHGILRDIWNVLLWFHDNYPDIIGKPESYTYECEFSDNPEPMLLAYQGFTNDAVGINGSIRNWPYLSVQDRILRGALLARIKVGDEYLYFFEIQRRIKILEDYSGNEHVNEEPFRGLVFKLNDSEDLKDWLDELMDLSRRTEGVLLGIAPKCPGMAELYKHKSAKTEKIPCEAAVRNALKKMGIKLPVVS